MLQTSKNYCGKMRDNAMKMGDAKGKKCAQQTQMKESTHGWTWTDEWMGVESKQVSKWKSSGESKWMRQHLGATPFLSCRKKRKTLNGIYIPIKMIKWWTRYSFSILVNRKSSMLNSILPSGCCETAGKHIKW